MPISFLGAVWIVSFENVRVALVLTSMPMAFNALAAASIFDLDLDMANSCWLVTTLGLIVILPWLYFLLSSGLLPI